MVGIPLGDSRRERNFWMQRRSAKNRSNARTHAETKIRESGGRKSRQERLIWRRTGNVRFARTGWWTNGTGYVVSPLDGVNGVRRNLGSTRFSRPFWDRKSYAENNKSSQESVERTALSATSDHKPTLQGDSRAQTIPNCGARADMTVSLD